MSLVTPFWEAPLATAPTAEMKAEFRGYASLYREALGSSSTVYRFLCFYKIIEGVQARRTRLAGEAKSAGRPVARYSEWLPDNDDETARWLNAIFPIRRPWDAMALQSAVPPEVRGKKLGRVVDSILRPIRVDVAHALSGKSGELTMSVDELLHIHKISKWLLLTKCIARRMLKNEFPSEFLSSGRWVYCWMSLQASRLICGSILVCLFPCPRRILDNWNCCVPAFGEAHQWAQAHFFVAGTAVCLPSPVTPCIHGACCRTGTGDCRARSRLQRPRSG